jgi:hypothetical protein
MARHFIAATAGHHVPGSYVSERAKTLAQAAQPDPRVWVGIEGPALDAAIEENLRTQPRQQRVTLDVDALEAWEPVKLPKWWLGGHDYPRARDWPQYHDPAVVGWLMYPDDRIIPIYDDGEPCSLCHCCLPKTL